LFVLIVFWVNNAESSIYFAFKFVFCFVSVVLSGFKNSKNNSICFAFKVVVIIVLTIPKIAFVLRLDETAHAMVQDEPWSDDDIPEEFQGLFCFGLFFILFIILFHFIFFYFYLFFIFFVFEDPIMSTLMRDPVTWEG
jgi:hypothetical protein